MDSPNDYIFIIALVMASITLISLWIAAFRIALRQMDSMVDKNTADQVANKLPIYFLSVIFWPAAVVFGYQFLQKPETAKTGRTCILIFFWFVTIVLVLVIVAMFFLNQQYPEIREYIFHKFNYL